MAKKCWVFDIDGTVADCTHRLHHIQKSPKDWTAFFADCRDDAPISHVVELVKALLRDLTGPAVIFVSGRSDECRDHTETWIEGEFDGLAAPVYMRKAGDHRDDDIVKIELLTDLRRDGWEPIMVFDDRNRVVKAWRAAGVPCAQVAEGDF